MTKRWCEPCMSGERARSWATSRGSGRGAPWPSRTTMPTTGARCISWISLAAIQEKSVSAKRRVCKKPQINTSFKTKLSPHLVVLWFLHLLGAQQRECGAYTQKHRRRSSLPIGRVYYVHLRENNKMFKKIAAWRCTDDVSWFSVQLTVCEEGVGEVQRPYESGERVVWGAGLDLPLDRRQLHFCQLSLQTSVGLLELRKEIKTSRWRRFKRHGEDFPLVGHLPWRCCWHGVSLVRLCCVGFSWRTVGGISLYSSPWTEDPPWPVGHSGLGCICNGGK